MYTIRIGIYSKVFLIVSIIAACQTIKENRIDQKNRCFNERLNKLKKSDLYWNVLSDFEDSFKVLIKRKEYFGINSYVDNKVDDAIFFKKDSSECLLIVLQKMNDSLYVFGS